MISVDKRELNTLQTQKAILLRELERGGIIKDKEVIGEMRRVPRENFVPEDQKKYAYNNRPLPIGSGQTISSPEIVSYMIQEAYLTKSSIVLEIGTGSGYQTAVLSLLCDKVISIERIPALVDSAKKVLKKLGYYTDKNNIEIELGDGYSTKYKENSFDAIIVAAAPPTVPEHLKKLLKVNGRLIVPVGESLSRQELLRITKGKGGNFIEEKLLNVKFVPMVKNNDI